MANQIMNQARHPDECQLSCYLGLVLVKGEAVKVRLHLRSCRSCQELIEIYEEPSGRDEAITVGPEEFDPIISRQ